MDPSAYGRYYELDQGHFWRVAKRRLVLEWLSGALSARNDLRLLDIGGACSVLSSELRRFGNVIVIEPDETMVAMARERHGLDAHRGSLPADLPVEGPFDVVTLLDVLEHVEDDLGALEAVRRLLSPGGIAVVTVPAVPWLWSGHDLSVHHVRRYSRRQLAGVIASAGLSLRRISYYTSLLFPLVALQRLVRRIVPPRHPAEYRVQVPNAMLNGALGAVMSVERLALRFTNMPFGSSLITLCENADGW